MDQPVVAVAATVFIGAVVVAIVELVKAIAERNYRTAILILASGLAGAIISLFDVRLGVEQVSVAQGIMIGLSASGAYKFASKIG